METGLRDHVAVVTGAGQGLGEEMVRMLAAEGCRTAVWDVDEQHAHRVSEEIRSAGGTSMAVVANVTDPASVRRAVDEVMKEFGGIQILVNNAGFSRRGTVSEMPLETWQDVIQVNLTGAFLCAQACLPTMVRAQYGRLIQISSRAYFGDANNSAYAASKAGMIALARSLALEVAVHGITSNAVVPGMVRTQRVQSLPHFEKISREARERTPIQRDGLPEDVAHAVLFLASKHSGFITGEALHVTGGRYASA